MDEREWKLVEKVFDKYGYSHVLNEMRLILYMRLSETDGWLTADILKKALKNYDSFDMNTFTFEQLEYEYDRLY